MAAHDIADKLALSIVTALKRDADEHRPAGTSDLIDITAPALLIAQTFVNAARSEVLGDLGRIKAMRTTAMQLRTLATIRICALGTGHYIEATLEHKGTNPITATATKYTLTGPRRLEITATHNHGDTNTTRTITVHTTSGSFTYADNGGLVTARNLNKIPTLTGDTLLAALAD